jgi:hypothetical protein
MQAHVDHGQRNAMFLQSQVMLLHATRPGPALSCSFRKHSEIDQSFAAQEPDAVQSAFCEDECTTVRHSTVISVRGRPLGLVVKPAPVTIWPEANAGHMASSPVAFASTIRTTAQPR